MQLIILLFVLLSCGGKGSEVFKQIKPLIENLQGCGGDRLADILGLLGVKENKNFKNSAERFTEGLNLENLLSALNVNCENDCETANSKEICINERECAKLPLEDIKKIADKKILNALSLYITCGA